MSAQSPTAAAAEPEFTLSPASRRVFFGLMLGMLVASISQTIVGPAMPRIVAELGGMEHYSWLATAAMLVSAVSVPIVGKLSDLYGRRAFYLGGLVVFMIGSIICGLSGSFWMLVAGRAVQGLGMGTLMPLSQTIIGDIIPPRARGKYQGIMGSVFGFTSIAGPLAGGFITDHWGWRWLFFVSLPVGIIALFVIARFLHLESERREAKIDFAGIVTMAVSLVCILLATSFGGTSYAWGSWQIITLYSVGTIFLLMFLFLETRAEEPVIPLRLFRSSIFTLSNLASFLIAIMMFGAIIYIPVYAQGVLGVNATNSGLILLPLMLGLIVVGMIGGWFISKTGRYKELTVAGVILTGVGYWLLTRLHFGSSNAELTFAMAVLGVGLGGCMQQYTLMIQNNARRSDLGVATATNQFFRNVGSTVGIAIYGTVMTSSMPGAIARHLPPEMAQQMGRGGQQMNAGSVLDPAALAKLPKPLADAIRMGLAESLHNVFVIGLPLAALAALATLFIKAVPLRNTISSGEEAGRELMDTMGQSSHSSDEIVPQLGLAAGHTRTRERILGLQLALLAEEAADEDRPLLRKAVADLGGGDLDRGIGLLTHTARMLTTEDQAEAARAEEYAAEVARSAARPGGVLSDDLRKEIAVLAAERESRQVLTEMEPPRLHSFEAVDVDKLHSAGADLTTAYMVDTSAELVTGRRGI
ncbi:hypothetical protein GCM10027418_02950 [Mariniluteicoccus endophyticus]